MNILDIGEILSRHKSLSHYTTESWVYFGKNIVNPNCDELQKQMNRHQGIPILSRCRECYKIFLNPHPGHTLEVLNYLCNYARFAPQSVMKIFNPQNKEPDDGEKIVIYTTFSKFINKMPLNQSSFLKYMFSTMLDIYRSFLYKFSADPNQQVRRHSVSIPVSMCNKLNLPVVPGRPQSPIIFARQSCNSYRATKNFTGVNGAFVSNKETQWWLEVLKQFTPEI